MPYSPRARLDEDLALRFRTDVRRALDRKGRTVPQLADKIRERRPIDDRTLRRYLSPGESLARTSAFEVAIACHALGARLPQDLLEDLYADEVTPAIIVLPGAAEHLAAALAHEASEAGVPDLKVRRLRKRFASFLAPYENCNDKEPLRHAVHYVTSYFHGKPALGLHRLQMAIGASADGSSYSAPSAIGMIKRAAGKGQLK